MNKNILNSTHHIKGLITLIYILLFGTLEGVQIKNAYALENYQPKLTVNLNNQKLWRRLDWLDSSRLFSMSVDPSGHLWLGLDTQIAFYNGSEVQYFGKEDGVELNKITAIRALSNGVVLAADNKRIYQYKDKKWKLIQTGLNIPYSAQFREGNDGRTWLAAANKLLAFKNEKITIYSGAGKFITDVLVDDNNQVWTLDLETGDVVIHKATPQELIVQKEFKGLVYSNERREMTYQAGQLLQSDSGAVWVVNSLSDVPPKSYEPSINVWREHQLPSNVNSAILQLPEGHIVVTGQSSLHILDNGLWNTVDNEKIDLTTSFNQLHLNEQGYVWLMQRRSAILRYDHAGKRNKIYDELFFQCEDVSGRQYFFNPEGDVVVHDKNTLSWLRYTQKDGLIKNTNQLICTASGDAIALGGHNNYLAFSVFKPEKNYWNTKQTQFSLSSASFVVATPNNKKHERTFLSINTIDTSNPSTGIYELAKTGNQNYQLTLFKSLHSRVNNLAILSTGDLISSSNMVQKISVNKPESKPEMLLNQRVDNMVVDHEDNVWVATWASGLSRFDGQHWTKVKQAEDTAFSRITQLFVTQTGDLLALAQGRLLRFDGNNWQAMDLANIETRRYGNQINQTQDGSVWVSTASYHWMFRNYYSEIKQKMFETIRYKPDLNPPETYIQWISAKDKYSNSIYFTLRGVDKWNETPSSNLQYSYRLNQGEWSDFSSQTTAFISDLKTGEHLLEARARDGDGNIDKTPYQLPVTINLPFWQTLWFWLLCAAMILAVVSLMAMLFIQRARNLVALEKARLQFLTHVSHELRTPLTLITSPLETLDKTALTDKALKKIDIALRNSKRLSSLVEQILDYRKVQAGKHKIYPLNGDVVAFCHSLANDFSEIAKQQDQSMVFHCEMEHAMCQFDPDVLHKILDNLIFNALKYSPQGSKVELSFSYVKAPSELIFTVEDCGEGINDKLLKNVFNPFFSGEKSAHQQFSSFGIGLALVKELVELWGGNLVVESPIHNKSGRKFGTRIRVSLPVDVSVIKQGVNPSTELNQPVDEEQTDLVTNKRPLVLLVDDHVELLEFLAEELSDTYQVIKADNAELAIKIAQQKVPDVIVSDVCMPGMDGVEMCRVLKSSTETSHIPLLLQTSFASESKQIEALKLGAIDFLTKPVSIDVLLSKISSQIRTREQLAQRFKVQHLATFDDNPPEFEQFESKFMKRVIDLVELHHSETRFSAEALAKEVGMSRSAFYRKFSAVVGIPPAEYIKNYRLDKAAQMLKQGAYIAEVAEKIGYTETSPFNRAFKKYFNLTPSQYRKQSKDKTQS
ncbi:helix-turn-helix domain-containing protein [Catenovulum adriaticum]|uniref:histidine kinase n=1 Tax=Catenovulum adriaticum TaxID=2984846 RepID=A0ABY7AQG7_9ALTE|nr:helix-turn-helix domain-containing protein [Catenovulum sp. TS8]WAJ71789.1 helix-turn-helix domain-containing protein [Catenovulum sp. TS8]